MSAMRLLETLHGIGKGWRAASACASFFRRDEAEHDLVLAGADDVADVEAVADEGGRDPCDVEFVDDHVDDRVDEFEIEDGPLAGDLGAVEPEAAADLPGGLTHPLHVGLVAADHRIGNPARGDQRRTSPGIGHGPIEMPAASCSIQSPASEMAILFSSAHRPSLGPDHDSRAGMVGKSLPSRRRGRSATTRCATRGHASLRPTLHLPTPPARPRLRQLGGGAAAVTLGADAGEGQTGLDEEHAGDLDEGGGAADETEPWRLAAKRDSTSAMKPRSMRPIRWPGIGAASRVRVRASEKPASPSARRISSSRKITSSNLRRRIDEDHPDLRCDRRTMAEHRDERHDAGAAADEEDRAAVWGPS